MILEYYIYEHTDSSEDTVYKFFNRNENLLSGISFIEFLKYTGDSDISNAERIYSKYTGADSSKYHDKIIKVVNSSKDNLDGSDFTDLPLEVNTVLFIPKSNFLSELISIKGKNLFLKQGDNDFFFANKLLQLLNDPQYVRSEDILYQDKYNSLEIINQNIQVWIWSRALGKIINVSPFITQMSTSKGDVGSFSFQLSPITDFDDIDFLNDQEILNFFPNNVNGESSLDYFYKKIQYNDLAFIRFERLEIDDSDRDSFSNSFEVDKNNLPKRVWDMIGLVDTVQQSSLFNSSDHIVSVSGRDLMKLLVEDGNYFMTLRYLENGKTILGFNREDRWFKRMFIDKDSAKKYSPYHFYNERRSINDTIGFIINQLSNIGVVDDNLFSGYDSNDDSNDEENGRRTKQYIVSGKSDENLKIDEINGIWQIVKVFFDNRLSDRRVVDSSIAYTDSTILEQFNKICQKPFVEFFGDTYGDEFNFVVRQPPFTKEMIRSFLYPKRSISYKSGLVGNYQIITLYEKDIERYNNLQWDETRYSWYQLQPHDSLLGKYSLEMAGGLVPIVYIEELANMYGSKRMVIPDNYLSSNIVEGVGSTNDSSKYREALINDLKYIIDSTSYLPFTRKGSITIPKGDRRIKKGTFIRIAPTNEIFYVDSVSHNFSVTNGAVNRSTTLNVSRGMVETYILGDVGYDENGQQIYGGRDREIKFSYFSIIETKIINKYVTTEEKIEDNTDAVDNSNELKYSVTIPETSRIAYEHNNPGNLVYANQANAEKGELKGNSKTVYWAKFDSPESGFKAVVNQINLDKSRGLTLSEFINKYSPASDNGEENTNNYIDSAKDTLNISSSTKISEVDTLDIAEFIVKKESSSKVSVKTSNNTTVKDSSASSQKTVKRTMNMPELSFKFNEEQFNFFMKRFQFNRF